MKGFLQKALRVLDGFEDFLLTLLTLGVLVLGGAQIVARYAFHYSWVWIDPASRAMVLWIALVGALVAAREGRHINVDAVTRLLSRFWLRVARIASYSFAGVISLMFARGSIELIKIEKESATIAFGQIPAWWIELILPIGFALLALRFFLHAFARDAQEPVPGSLA